MADVTGQVTRMLFAAEVSAAIEENLAHTNYGDILAERGIANVALDDDGRIIEYRPDRTSVVVETSD